MALKQKIRKDNTKAIRAMKPMNTTKATKATRAKEIISKYGVYLIAVILFVACAAIYCEPATRGKVITGGDNLTFVGAAHESLQYTKDTGGKDSSWWTGSMFSGMPTYQIGGGARFKSVGWLSPITKPIQRNIPNPVWAMFLCFACFYILLLAFGISPWISLWGAITIGLSSYFITLFPAGHLFKIATIALTAVVFAGFKLIFDKKYILGALLTMVFVAAGYNLHPQMFYYYFMMIGVLWIAELCQHIIQKRWKDLSIATAIFVLATGIGIGTGSAGVLVNREYLKESTRSGSVLDAYPKSRDAGLPHSEAKTVKGLDLKYVTKWSYGIDETFSLLIPGFKGGASHQNINKDSYLCRTLAKNNQKWNGDTAPLYWGRQPFTYGNTYVGAIVCFLFLLGLLIVKGPYKWGLLVCTIFSIMLSWGENFLPLTTLFYKYFPMYSKFRAVTSILIVAEVAMPLLGLLAINEILKGRIDRKTLLRSVGISAGITVAICLFFAIAGNSLYSFTSDKDSEFTFKWTEWTKAVFIDQRRILFRNDCIRSTLFILGAASLICLSSVWKKKTLPLFMLLGFLSVADLWGVDRRYFSDNAFHSPKHTNEELRIDPVTQQLLLDPDPNFRVYNRDPDAFNESKTSYYFKSIGGYSAVKLSRYDDLIEEHLKKGHSRIFDMLNTKYILVPAQDGKDPYVIRNTAAKGNAWFVNEIAWVDNPRDEINLIDMVDLGNTAVIHSEFKPLVEGNSFSKSAESGIVLTEYRPNHLEYRSSSPCPTLAVFSEIYYPHGWIARIDGEKHQHFRANYLLRAMNIPAGDHTISFDFDPVKVKVGDSIALIFIILMYVSIAAAIAYFIIGKYRKWTA